MNKWIDVRERKPTEEDANLNNRVLMALPNNRMSVWLWYDLQDAVAWMSIPEWKPIDEPPPGYRLVDTSTEPFRSDAKFLTDHGNWLTTSYEAVWGKGLIYAVPE